MSRPRSRPTTPRMEAPGSRTQDGLTDENAERAPSVVTLLTDYGQRDGFVGVLRGIVLGICPRAQIVDLSHDVPAHDVMAGALILESAVPHFPRGTVHLAVVDPGVGSDRRAILIETDDFVLVGPDNGLLSLAAEASPRRCVVELDGSKYLRPDPSRTFHGRDVFAPIAAHAARGVSANELGRETAESYMRISIPVPRRLEHSVEGQLIYVDRFGNLVTNVRIEDLLAFRGEEVSVTIAGVRIRGISTHYAAAREGSALAVWNSWGRLEIAVRNGSAVRHLRTRVGDRVVVHRDSAA